MTAPHLDEMVFVLEFAKYGCWVFAVCDEGTSKQEITKQLQTSLNLPIYTWSYSQDKPNPNSYLQNLSEAQKQQRALVVLSNILGAGEQSLGWLEESYGLFARYPHSLVFWVTEMECNEIAMGAEHFWLLRRGVFDFSSAAVEEAPKPEPITEFQPKPKFKIKETIKEEQSHTHGHGHWLNCLVEVEDHQQAAQLLEETLKGAKDVNVINADSYSKRTLQTALPIAETFDKLSFLFYYLGRYAEAVPYCEKAIDIYDKVLGKTQYPVISSATNNLAVLYERLERFTEAEKLLQETLDVLEKQKNCSADIATVLNNLAWLHSAQGDYARAKPLYEKSLAIREEALGPDHPDVASGLNDLAILCCTLGDYAKVERMFQRSVAILEKVLGKDHLGVAGSLNNLARVYEIQGKYAEAEPLYHRCLAIKARALGTEHPSVAGSINNLASLYQAQGKYDQAEAGFQKSLEIREKTLGEDHPQVASSLNSLATLYDKQGKVKLAENYYKKAITIAEKKLGKFHSETLRYQKNYRLFLKKTGQPIG